jgi:hypothetical protein
MTPNEIDRIVKATEFAIERGRQLAILHRQFAVAEEEAVGKLLGLRTNSTYEEFFAREAAIRARLAAWWRK